jgi:poly(3-hydroxybutyrate) depolymerase
MKLQLRTLIILLAALLTAGRFVSPAASAASSPEDEPLFHQMAHSVEVEGEARVYFTYRPQGREPNQDEPLLLLVSRDEDGVLAWAQRTGLLEAAEAEGTRLVLIDRLTLRDHEVLNEVLELI